ncbi:MAG: V-type ATPase subunit, partial [Candidatus Nanohaloarchaea archaeon]|nr:V-type ATPase subunit [Candidatus Nanohaloarchaea archaeon]
GNLQEIERIIDTHYYRHLARTAERLPEQGRYFKTFLQLELELKNINLILRMKKAGYERGRIEDELLDIPGSLSTHDYAQLLEAQDYSAAVDVLKDMKVGEYIEDEDITHVERALDRYKLRKGILMLHQSPLSINPILGYMISKEAEVQNLRIILQAKRNDLGSEFIQTNIIPQVRER